MSRCVLERRLDGELREKAGDMQVTSKGGDGRRQMSETSGKGKEKCRQRRTAKYEDDRQDKTTTPHRKQVTLVAVNYYKKKYLSLLESKTSLRARRAVQCWLRVVRMPWYLWYPGQYLGTSGWTPVRVRWVPRSTREKKNSAKKDRILKVVCPSGSSHRTRNRTLRRAAYHWSHTKLSDFAVISLSS